MFRKIILQSAIILGAGLMATSCATISESECVAGNWADIGYKDGVQGVARSRIADYVKKCGEYGQGVDRNLYLSNFETGLSYYCTYDKGFERGKGGNGYNTVCDGPQAADFRAGYDDGFAQYELKKRYERFEYDIHETEDQIEDIRKRLQDSELSAEEKTRLRKKKKRLSSELYDLKWDFREFRREYNFD